MPVLKEKIDALDPNKNETYKFRGWEQSLGISHGKIKEKNKKEVGPSNGIKLEWTKCD